MKRFLITALIAIFAAGFSAPGAIAGGNGNGNGPVNSNGNGFENAILRLALPVFNEIPGQNFTLGDLIQAKNQGRLEIIEGEEPGTYIVRMGGFDVSILFGDF